MSLPSQSARPAATTAAGRSNMVRRKRPNLKPILAAVGVITIVAVGVWAMTRSGALEGTLQSAKAAPKSDAPAKPLSPPPAAEPPANKVLATNPAPEPRKDPPPLELRQGRSQQGEPQAAPSAPAQTTGGLAPLAQPTTPPLGHPAGAGGGTLPKTDPAAANAGAGGAGSAGVPAAMFTGPTELQPTIAAARQKQASGELVTARTLYSRALADARMNEADKASLRTELTKINDDLVFSPRVSKDDPFTDTYVVQSGDSLITIARKLVLGPDYRLIARINKMTDKHRVNLGQKLKVVKGPFHAVVNKSAYRLDLYMGPSDKQDQWVYIRSFRVGLGEANSTPIGTFTVKKGSKLIDPPWINPRTGEKFGGGDPKNPIGHRWVGLQGTGDAAQFTGYGLHGTIDPDSIGQQRSMGCVRMGNEDIDLVFELMGETVSVVKIVP